MDPLPLMVVGDIGDACWFIHKWRVQVLHVVGHIKMLHVVSDWFRSIIFRLMESGSIIVTKIVKFLKRNKIKPIV